MDRQTNGLHVLHLFDVTTEQSTGEVTCVAKRGSEQTVCHTDLIVFPQYYEELTNDEDEVDDVYSGVVVEGIPLVEPEYEMEDPMDNICPAYIICGLQDCTALIGDQVVLEVIYGGNPEPTIKWLKAVSYCRRSGNLRSDTRWLVVG